MRKALPIVLVCISCIVLGQGQRSGWTETFKEFPIRQKAVSFSLDRVMEKLMPRAA